MLFEIFINPKILDLNNNFASIMANVSSDETGRQVLLEKGQLLEKIYPFFFHKNKYRRVGVLKTLRNMSFEY
jgi:hypothetical protein